MITKEKLRERVLEILDDIRPLIEKKLDILLECEALDLDDKEDNWAFPKEIVVALVNEVCYQYSNPFATRKDKNRIKKIENAIALGYSYEKI